MTMPMETKVIKANEEEAAGVLAAARAVEREVVTKRPQGLHPPGSGGDPVVC